VPQPQPAAPEVARAKTGDLVDASAEGVTPPRMTRRVEAVYPPVARTQRIEGLVIVSALVNENGQVIDTKIIRGVPRGNLNEAAIESVRRSSYAPAMKDGVRVKTWMTVAVNFKL
jgi:protein TonB